MGNQERFRAYLDESENSSSGIYVVGGFVAEATVWDALEPKWLSCLPPGITSFHTTDCFTGNNEFDGVSISDRSVLLNKLTEIIVGHEIRLVGYGIDAKTYGKLAPKAKENEFLRNKYAAPFGGVVQPACEAMGNLPTPETVWNILENGEQWEQCAFFIESNEYSASANRTIAELRASTDLWFRGRIGTETYGAKSGPAGITLLQVADFGAFLAAKHVSKAPEGKIPWKELYEKLKNADHVYRTVQADEYSLKVLHQTHEELKKEAAEGRHYWDDI
jgi:hypothetical protein